MGRLLVLACLLVGVVAVPTASGRTSSGLAGFHTPEWAAQCVVAEDTLGGPSPLICWTPNDGFTVRMGPSGRVSKSYYRPHKGYRDRFFAKRLLRYGQHWGFRITYVGYVYRCVGRATGLTCWNQAGHGWWLGRYKGYRVF